MAIRGMDVAAETIGIRSLRTKLLAPSISTACSRYQCKRGLRAAAADYLKIALSHCIFRPMASSERTGGGQEVAIGNDSLGKSGAAGAPGCAWRRPQF
jgi:hypothetical protein